MLKELKKTAEIAIEFMDVKAIVKEALISIFYS